MDVTTIGVYLGYRDAEGDYTSLTPQYKKVADIIDYPDLFGDIETIETTTMSNLRARTYKRGLMSTDSLPFTAKYDKELFSAIDALSETEHDFALIFKQDNSVFQWRGDITVGLTGAGVSELAQMTITLTASKEPKLNSTVKSVTYDKEDEPTTFTLA